MDVIDEWVKEPDRHASPCERYGRLSTFKFQPRSRLLEYCSLQFDTAASFFAWIRFNGFLEVHCLSILDISGDAFQSHLFKPCEVLERTSSLWDSAPQASNRRNA